MSAVAADKRGLAHLKQSGILGRRRAINFWVDGVKLSWVSAVTAPTLCVCAGGAVADMSI